jgi:signal transduction histidine kinase
MTGYPIARARPVIAIFAAAGLLSGTANVVFSRARGQSVPAADSLAHALLVWLLFGALAFIGLWTARRFPLEPPRVVRHLPAHLAALLVISFSHTLVYTAVMGIVRDDKASLLPAPAALLGNLRGDVFIYALVTGAYYLYAYRVRYRERERAAHELAVRSADLEAALATARLDTLRSQLQPHFLFNTLNSVSTLILKAEPERAVRMLNRLADLLRASLATGDGQLVTLRQEMDLVQRYLDIEAERFPDRLRASISVAPDVAETPVPVLVLQPLVENAVRHGIAAAAESGTISIRATRDREWLRLEVRDDGAGPGDAGRQEGIGLANTRERLHRLYGPKARLTLSPAIGGGAIATVEIPL